MAIVSKKGFTTKTIDNEITKAQVEEIEFDIAQIERSGYETLYAQGNI